MMTLEILGIIANIISIILFAFFIHSNYRLVRERVKYNKLLEFNNTLVEKQNELLMNKVEKVILKEDEE